MLSNKNFLIIAFVNFFVMTAYYLLFVVSGPYAVQCFGVSASMGGLVAGIMLIGCLAGRFVTGRIIELLGFRLVLFAGIAIYITGIGLYLAVDSLTLLLLVRFLSGLGVGCIGTVTGTLVVHIVPKALHGRGISYFSLSTILAMAIGPFLGIFLMQLITFKDLFLLCLGLGAVTFGLSLFLAYPFSGKKQITHTAGRGFHLWDYIEPAAIPVALVTLVISACYGCVQAFLPLYAEETGLTAPASLFFLVYATVALFSRPFTGRIFDSKGANPIVYPALGCTALGLALLGLADSAFILLFSGALLGGGVGNMQTIAQAASIRLVSHERYGQATATHFIFLDFGIGLGPYVLGFLVPGAGYNGMYLVCALLALLCFPLYRQVYGKHAVAGASRAGQGAP